MCFFCMTRRPPSTQLTDPLCPAPTLFRSSGLGERLQAALHRLALRHRAVVRQLQLQHPAVDLEGAVVQHPARGGADPVRQAQRGAQQDRPAAPAVVEQRRCLRRSEEHTSELQSLMRISYAVFCLKKKKSHIVYLHTLTYTHINTKHITTDSINYIQ